MFGYTRIRKCQLNRSDIRTLNSYYCGLCHALRKDYGLPFSVFTNWDGRFLALLIESQGTDNISSISTRCPATMGIVPLPASNFNTATTYSAAITILLLGEKIEDGIKDRDFMGGKLLKRITNKHVDQAKKTLNNLGFPLQKAFRLRKKQQTIENTDSRQAISRVVAPSAEVVSLFFAHTANLANAEYNYASLSRIGGCVGRLVTLLDSCHDFASDWDKNRFNALVATFPEKPKNLAIPYPLYIEIEDYFLAQLKMIRSEIKNLVLNQHQSLVKNVLIQGLYDSVSLGCRKLSEYIFNLVEENQTVEICHSCREVITSRFCTNCGTRVHLLNNFRLGVTL